MPQELMLPPYLRPAEIELELADAVGLFQPEFGFAVSQRLDYGASSWRARVTFEVVRDAERHELLALLARAGRVRPVMIPVYGEGFRGVSSYFAELLNPTNEFFVNSTSGWTNEGQLVLAESGRVLRGTVDSSPGSSKIILRNDTLTGVVAAGAVNFPHVHRTLLMPGRNAVGFGLTLREGIAANGAEYGSATASYGYYSNVFVPTTTTLSCQLRDTGSATLAVGDYFETSFFSASRCGVVTTSGQTGGGIYTGGWPSSISNLIRAGDFVNVHLPNALHLGRLTAPLHTTSGGLGYLQIEPGLPEAVPSSAAVVPFSPFLKAVLLEPPRVRTRPPGYQTDVELNLGGVFG